MALEFQYNGPVEGLDLEVMKNKNKFMAPSSIG